MLEINKRLSGTAAVLIAAFFWSMSPFLVKYLPIDPLLLPCLRASMAGLLFLPWFRPRQLIWSWRLPLMVVCFAGISVCAVMSFRLTAAANATALYFSSPLWVFVFTSIMAKRVPTRSLPPILLLIIGIIVILLEPKAGSNQLGNLMGVVAGLVFAIFALSYNRLPLSQRINHLALCNLCACPLIFLLIFTVQPQSIGDIAAFPARIWAFLLLMAVTQQMIPYFLYGIALSKLPILRVSMLCLGEFVLSPVWTLLLLHEVPTIYGICGWLLILAGLLFNLYLSVKEEHSVSQTV